MESISFSLGGKRILTVIKRSKYKGDILYGDVVGLLPPDTGVGRKDVYIGKRSVAYCERGRVRGLHKEIFSVVFRSPVASLGPAVGVKGRVKRTIIVRGGGCAGRRMGGGILRLVRLMNVSRPGRQCRRCP